MVCGDIAVAVKRINTNISSKCKLFYGSERQMLTIDYKLAVSRENSQL